MIIVNRNADYSAVSIGHVDIPFEDSDASRLMAQYSKSISQANATAFAHLIADLKTAGLKDYIQCMQIPFLAANGAEAYKDSWRETNSTFNASTHLGFHLGKYGSYYVKEELAPSPRPSCPYVTTGIEYGAVTLASLSYFKESGADPITTAGSLWNSRAYLTGGNPNYNIAPGINISTGKNIIITSISSGTTATAVPKIMHNGTASTKSYSASQIEAAASIDVIKMAVSCFDKGTMDPSSGFVSTHCQVAIAILFNKELSDIEKTALNTALDTFSTAIYENDITTIM